MAEKLAARWPQPVVVENKPGAGGAVAVESVARGAADGYTLLWGGTGVTVLPAVAPKPLPYDVQRDLTAVARVADIPMVVIAGSQSGIRTLADLVAKARQKPGDLVYASGGPGSLQHLTGELLAARAGVQLSHVPYRGSGPAVNDLIGGQVDMMFDNLPSSIEHAKAGTLRPLAVTSAQRSPAIPNVPTLAESGLPGFEATSWFALFAPKGTPAAIVAKLNQEVRKALETPELQKRFAELGGEIRPMSPDELAAYVRSEHDKWAKVVKTAGARLD